MEFRKAYVQYDKPKKPDYEKIVMTHRVVLEKDGTKKYIKDVPKNIYEHIQAGKEECDIQKIIERANGGDLSVYNSMQGTYMDVINAPKSIGEAQALIHKMDKEFAELPKEVRQKYDNDVKKYVADYGTQNWLEKTGLLEKANKMKAETEQQEQIKANFTKAIENISKMKVGEVNE